MVVAGNALLDLVATIGDGPAGPHHRCIQIGCGGNAAHEQAAVAIFLIAATLRPPLFEHCGKEPLRLPPAVITRAVALACLAKFRRIDTRKTDAPPGKGESIAIDSTRQAGKRLRRTLVKDCRRNGDRSQNCEHTQKPESTPP